ncbi:MAG: trigger factor [Lachnospiraceae bacterium]
MKRRVVAMCLAVCLAFTMTACGNSDKEGKGGDNESAASDEESASQVLKAVDLEDLSQYFTLGEYKGLTTTRTVYDITDEDVDYQIQSALEYNATAVTDRPIQEGDIANIDYVGTIDGEEFEGGSGSNYDLTIGSQTFIEGFEEGLIGVSSGEEVDVNVTFPDPYENNEELSGKPAVFHVTVNGIYEIPELTDEWVQENTESANVEEYKALVREQLEANSGEQADYEVKTALFEQVLANSEVSEYPEELLEAETEAYKKQVETLYATNSGMTLDDFITTQGFTVEQFENICEEGAKTRLQQKMVVQAIMDAEGIEITQGEYESMLEEYASFYGFEDGASMVETYGEDMVKFNILWDEVCTFLIDNAEVTETEDAGTAEGTEEPAEEPAEETPAE